MTTYGNLPFQSAAFDEHGNLTNVLPTPAATDLIVIAHGWKNDADEATGLYSELLSNLGAALSKIASGRKYAAIGVYWPSKAIDFDGRGDMPDGPADAGGAAGFAGDAAPDVNAALSQLSALYNADNPALQMVQRLVEDRSETPRGSDLVRALRDLVPQVSPSELDASESFFNEDPLIVYEYAKAGPVALAAVDGDNGDGGAQGFGDLFHGVENAFANLLNVGTYYTMKARAATIGSIGVAQCLDKWADNPLLERIHLIGHSFGARLVTSAAMASRTPKLASMSLLQGAFSHNGFASGHLTGYFRNVVEKHRINGPVLVTHSDHDSAVGKAYAVASRISGENAASIGGKSDQFGGLGANGALNMLEGESSRIAMLAANEAYALRLRHFNNVDGSEYITDHSDVRNPTVAWAVASAILATH